jgi:predicted metal-binding membrane protein
MEVAGRSIRFWPTPYPIVLLLGLSAIGWALTLRWAIQMGNGPGTMGLGMAPFVGVWLVMMAAMMLPTVTTMGTAFGSPLTQAATSLQHAAGYLLLWAVPGVVAYTLSRDTQSLVDHHRQAAATLAVALFATCAVYQFSPWKWQALRSCECRGATQTSPLAAGARYGARCLAVSWSAMSLLFALGFMQPVGMIIIAAALLVERRAQSRLVTVSLGVCAMAYGVAIAVHPTLAPGLSARPMGKM